MDAKQEIVGAPLAVGMGSLVGYTVDARGQVTSGTYQRASLLGKVNVSGTLNFRDKDGNVVKTMEFNAAAPLSDFVSQEQEIADGADNR